MSAPPPETGDARAARAPGGGGGVLAARAVVFDLDGTLLDSIPGIAASIDATRRALGLDPLGVARVKRLVGWGVDRLVEGAFPAEPEPLRARARAAYLAHYGATATDTAHCLPGAAEAVRALRARGIAVGVATNKPQDFTETLLRAVGLDGEVGTVAGARADGPHRLKPAPDLLLAALAGLAVKASEALYVGDMTVDVETGRAAGVRVLGVTTGPASARELREAGAVAVLASLVELPALVGDWP